MMNFFDYIPDLEKSPGTVFFLRHAEREKILSPEDTLRAPLTEHGLKEAYRLGTKISGFQSVKAYWSPVPRCENTAKRILLGMEENGIALEDARSLELLGGPYVKDWNLLFPLLYEQGLEKLTQNWRGGNLEKDVMHEFEMAAIQQLTLVTESLLEVKPNCLHILVSHDWNVLLLREYLFGKPFEELGWPGFMDGLVFQKKPEAFTARYHDLTGTVR